MKDTRTYAILACLLVLATFISNPGTVRAQQTVGLFLNDPASWEGYTLFAPVPSTTTYLIDNDGLLVHSWESAYRPGQAAYLTEDGLLLRTG